MPWTLLPAAYLSAKEPAIEALLAAAVDKETIAILTIAQDKDTSVVHGMPGEAIRLGGATYVLPPEKISMTLTSLVARAGSEPGTERVHA